MGSKPHVQLLMRGGIVVCFFAVFFMSVRSLRAYPLTNPDEYRTLFHIFPYSISEPQSLAATVSSLKKHSSQHGPLYFILLNMWSRAAGTDLFSLRLLSAYFAMISLASIYCLASLTRNAHLGLAALLIVAFLPLFSFYSHVLRMYTLLPFFTAWIVWSYWRLLERPKHASWHVWLWLSFAVSSGLILYVHIFGIFILAAVGIYHLLFVPKNKRWLEAPFALVAGGMLFLPWLSVVIEGLSEHTRQISIANVDNMTALEAVAALASVYSNDIWMIPAGFAMLIIWNRNHLGKLERFLLILTCLTVAVAILTNEFVPLLFAHRMRYTIIFAPLLICSLAVGWSFLPKRAYIQLPLIGIWILSFFLYAQSERFYTTINRGNNSPYLSIPFQIFVYHPDIAIEPVEPILSLDPFENVNYVTRTYYQLLLNPASLVHLYYNGADSLVIQATKKELASLDQFVANYASFWLIYNPHRANPQTMGGIFQWMHNYYRSCGRTVDNADEVIERFVRDSDPC